MEDAPELTGTPWDAVIAATIEHSCASHHVRAPEWTNEEERFETRPWARRLGAMQQCTALGMCPAAFIRHNVFIDPRVLDERTGDEAWTTEQPTHRQPAE